MCHQTKQELAVDTHDCLWSLTQGCEQGRAWLLEQSPPAHGGAAVAVEHLVWNAAHFVVVVPRQLGAGTDVPETDGDWRVERPRLRATSTQTAMLSLSIGISQRLLNLALAQMYLKQMEGPGRRKTTTTLCLAHKQHGSARQSAPTPCYSTQCWHKMYQKWMETGVAKATHSNNINNNNNNARLSSSIIPNQRLLVMSSLASYCLWPEHQG